MPIFSFSHADLDFKKSTRRLIQEFYTNAKVLLITIQIKLINKKEFIKMILDRNSKTFVIFMTILEIFRIIIYIS